MDRRSGPAAVDRAMRSYYAAVAQGDAAAAARHFTTPAAFLTSRGARSAATTAEIEASFVALLRDFKAQDHSHNTWAESHMKLLGETAALASLVVVRHRTDGTEIGTFGFTYLLREAESEWKIAALIGHPPDDVLRFA